MYIIFKKFAIIYLNYLINAELSIKKHLFLRYGKKKKFGNNL